VPYPNGLSSSKLELSAAHDKAAVMNEKDRALDFGKIDCLSIHPP
jgi:hypothetical protein